MTKQVSWMALAIGGALVWAGGSADATTLARMDLDELTATATAVARVRCLGNESRWEGREIWTLTSFEVEETFKGAIPRLITVRLVGGKVGHLISTVNGVPRFLPGEEVIVFLERTSAGDFSVTSWIQGTFRIRRDVHTGRERVTQDTAGVAIFDPATRQFQAGGTRDLPFEVFRERLAKAIERQQSHKKP